MKRYKTELQICPIFLLTFFLPDLNYILKLGLLSRIPFQWVFWTLEKGYPREKNPTSMKDSE